MLRDVFSVTIKLGSNLLPQLLMLLNRIIWDLDAKCKTPDLFEESTFGVRHDQCRFGITIGEKPDAAQNPLLRTFNLTGRLLEDVE